MIQLSIIELLADMDYFGRRLNRGKVFPRRR
jgi:hypothetical protein